MTTLDCDQVSEGPQSYLNQKKCFQLYIITEKARPKERKGDGVGVMKDKELKLEDVKSPHTLG